MTSSQSNLNHYTNNGRRVCFFLSLKCRHIEIIFGTTQRRSFERYSEVKIVNWYRRCSNAGFRQALDRTIILVWNQKCWFWKYYIYFLWAVFLPISALSETLKCLLWSNIYILFSRIFHIPQDVQMKHLFFWEVFKKN